MCVYLVYGSHTRRTFSHLDLVFLNATTRRVAHLPPKHHKPYTCEEAHLLRFKHPRDRDEGHDSHSHQHHFQRLQGPQIRVHLRIEEQLEWDLQMERDLVIGTSCTHIVGVGVILKTFFFIIFIFIFKDDLDWLNSP